MTYREKDIAYENGRFWVLKEYRNGRNVFKVFEANGATHVSTIRGTYDIANGLERAKARADELAAN